MRTRRSNIILAATAAVAYFAVDRAGYALAVGSGSVTLWLPSGVALALLLLNPVSRWPAVVIGAAAGSVASDLLGQYPVWLAMLAAGANMLESVVAARVLMFLMGPRPIWGTIRGVLTFTLGVVVLANAVTALAGAAVLSLGFKVSFLPAWLVWWAGDGLGMLIVTPAILAWAAAIRARRSLSRRDALEAGVIAACLIGASALALGPYRASSVQPGAYIVFPFLFWAALRFGTLGAASASFTLAELSTWFALAGAGGPFAPAGRAAWQAELRIYVFLAVASASSLIFAAAIEERRVSTRQLQESEERFRRAQKLEAVGKLAGGIAHDFNNLLTVIQGNCDLLGDALPSGTQAREDLMQIRSAAQRAAALTRQLLAFSRRQMLAPRVLRLPDVLSAIEPMLRRLLGGEIAVEIPPSTAAPVLADLSQLEQVIVNLAVNARDAMPEGGTLRFTVVDEILAGAEAAGLELTAGAYVRMDVSDTGVGIDAAALAHLFEPFFTTKPEGQGTGLGLATVHGIMRQSNGAIDVRSQPGQGTTFTLYFPRAPAS